MSETFVPIAAAFWLAAALITVVAIAIFVAILLYGKVMELQMHVKILEGTTQAFIRQRDNYKAALNDITGGPIPAAKITPAMNLSRHGNS